MDSPSFPFSQAAANSLKERRGANETAADADLLKVVSLQDENLGTQLLPEQKKDGFLSTRFTVEQFAEFNAEAGAGIVVSLQSTSDLA